MIKILLALLLSAANAQTITPSGTGGGGSGTVTSIATGCQATGGTITTTGTISTQITPTDVTAANPPITAGYCGGLENLDNGSNQIPTIAVAGSVGFLIGWYTDLCNINTGTQTITPASGTIGGAATYLLAAGTAAAPKCVRIISDGVSNYLIEFPPSSGSGTVTTLSVVTANGVSGSVANPTTTPAVTLTLGAIVPTTVNGNTITTGTGTLTLGAVTLNAGAGGTLGSNAFTSTAYAPLASPTFSGTVTLPDASVWNSTNLALAPAGTLTNPTLTFTTCGSNCGWLAPAANQLEVSVGGVNKLDYNISNGNLWSIKTGVVMSGTISMQNQGISNVGAVTGPSAGGGNLTFTTPNSAGAGVASGDITLTGGNGSGTGASNGGSITFTTGTSVNGSAGTLRYLSIISDATHTDSSICQDTTTHAFYSGSGTLGVCLGTSSARYKNNITGLSDGLSQIMALTPKNFFYNPDHGDYGAREQYGFLAEDMISVLPKLVGLDTEGKPNSVDILGIVPILVKALQEQQKQIDALQVIVHHESRASLN